MTDTDPASGEDTAHDSDQRDDPLPSVETHVEGVEVAPSIEDQPGLSTYEGRIGMLLQGESIQTHFIEMPPGLYLDEHAHETESMIMTLSGEWVLSARGERRHMTEGDLFWFGPGVPTGYEVPFDEDAYILIFKGEVMSDSAEAFVDSLRATDERLAEEAAEGTPFTFDDLPDDHPAIEFAESIGAR
ncbi:cupin domain-containing protein [Halovivax cerinus]|uniref:Cupin domain-containing protein n=1 Tax=Halovivax cerinus TaxID=1487865 RepID=A0ABD5NLQ3_9EURY|nr:cupin domain-containing protein [Halovivax cerinus]